MKQDVKPRHITLSRLHVEGQGTDMQPEYVYDTTIGERGGQLFSARGVGHRLTIAMVGVSLALSTILDTGGRWYQLVAEAGWPGYAFVSTLLFTSILSIADVLINDVLGDKYMLPATLRLRMYSYMLQATLNISMVVVVVHDGQWAWSASTYCVLSLSCVWIAVMDTYHRYVLPRSKGFRS